MTALAGRALPILLGALLVALMVSISAAAILAGLAILAAALHLAGGAHPARALVLGWPLLAYAGVTVVSALAAPERGDALWSAKHLLAVPLLWAARLGFGDGARARRLLAWLFGTVGVVSAYAILQVGACQSHAPLPTWLGTLLRLKLEACRQADYWFRAKGFFSIYMTLGGSLLVTLALLAALLTYVPRRHLYRYAAPAVLAFTALLLTYVRNAWLGLAVAVLTLLLLTRRRRLVVALAAAAVVLAGLWTVAPPLRARVLSLGDAADPTARDRLQQWETGLRMVAAAPVLGHGPGGVRRHYADYRTPNGRLRTPHLHNNVVHLAAEVGLLGLAAWAAVWVAFFVRAGAVWRALAPARFHDRALVAGSMAAVAGFLAAGLFEYNYGDTEIINLVWVVMALPFVVAPDAPRPGSSPGSG